MNAGELRHRVELQSNDGSRDSFGGVTDSWTTFATVWGSVRAVSGAEKIIGDTPDAESKILVVVRYNSSVTTSHRIKWSSRIFEINSIVKGLDERNIYQRIYCTEAVT